MLYRSLVIVIVTTNTLHAIPLDVQLRALRYVLLKTHITHEIASNLNHFLGVHCLSFVKCKCD